MATVEGTTEKIFRLLDWNQAYCTVSNLQNPLSSGQSSTGALGAEEPTVKPVVRNPAQQEFLVAQWLEYLASITVYCRFDSFLDLGKSFQLPL